MIDSCRLKGDAFYSLITPLPKERAKLRALGAYKEGIGENGSQLRLLSRSEFTTGCGSRREPDASTSRTLIEKRIYPIGPLHNIAIHEHSNQMQNLTNSGKLALLLAPPFAGSDPSLLLSSYLY